MSHLVIETNNCLGIDQLFGHYEVEARDLIELLLPLLAVQAANFVVKAGQPHVGSVVQAAPRFSSTLRPPTVIAFPSLIE